MVLFVQKETLTVVTSEAETNVSCFHSTCNETPQMALTCQMSSLAVLSVFESATQYTNHSNGLKQRIVRMYLKQTSDL